ncbi:ABC transporter permease [Halobacillus rhizosphaerae]|uniref:ABC transporter permease n=1 Tax=Halobacillus rhizosphaerae TaxID=3064889 RepID=UPI00398AA774
MLPILRADLLKIKRKWFWFLVFLGPFGVIALQTVNYGLRYDYLLGLDSDVWGFLIQNINLFVPLALILGMTILASQLASLEHKQSSWKQLLSLPVRRRDVFVAKFLVAGMMLAVSCVLLWIGSLALGLGLGFSWESAPLVALLKNSFYPLFAGLPVLAIQNWLSIVVKNQAGPLSIGIFGAVFSVAGKLPDWVFWKWTLMTPGENHLPFVGLGILAGLLIIGVGVMDFRRRDIA